VKTARPFAILLVFAACARQETPAQRQGKTTTMTQPRSIRVVAIGDSLAYGIGDESGRGLAMRLKEQLEKQGFAEAKTVNLGASGAQTADLIARLKQPRIREALTGADAIVLSIGANDLFRTPTGRAETLRAPLLVAERILSRIDEIVAELHRIAPRANVFILGGYNPVPTHPEAPLIAHYLEIWDAGLAAHFEDDGRVTVVKLADLVTPQLLSRRDHFHPGGSAYEKMAERIAAMLAKQSKAA
jgi:lysophospholipase L1-like esterase